MLKGDAEIAIWLHALCHGVWQQELCSKLSGDRHPFGPIRVESEVAILYSLFLYCLSSSSLMLSLPAGSHLIRLDHLH